MTQTICADCGKLRDIYPGAMHICDGRQSYPAPRDEVRDLIARLRERYTPTPIPPCRICGGKLSLQAAGGGEPSVWACTGRREDGTFEPGRAVIDEHYGNSRYLDYGHADSDVLLVLDLLAAAPRADPTCPRCGSAEVLSLCDKCENSWWSYEQSMAHTERLRAARAPGSKA